MLAFFVAATSGMTFIVLAKLSALTQLQITAVPIIILLLYAFMLVRWRRLTLRDDQSGDNLYYLGFLYSLTSIAVSLYQFGLDQQVQEQIITNFGIAISTTIVGLALRVMFNQMRQDPAEVERIARLELAEAARRLRRELDDVVMELNVFQRAVQQSLADNQRTIQEKLTEFLQISAGSLGDVTNTIKSDFGGSVGDLTKRVSSLSKSTSKADGALTGFSEQLAALKVPQVIIELRLEPVLQKFEMLLDEARIHQADHTQRLAAAVSALQAAAIAVQTSAETARQVIEENNLVAKNLDLEQSRRGWRRTLGWFRRRSDG